MRLLTGATNKQVFGTYIRDNYIKLQTVCPKRYTKLNNLSINRSINPKRYTNLNNINCESFMYFLPSCSKRLHAYMYLFRLADYK